MQIHELMFLNSLFNFFGPKLFSILKSNYKPIVLINSNLAYHIIDNSLNK